MTAPRAPAARARKPSPLREGRLAGQTVAPGASGQVELKVSETATHQPMRIPVHVVRGLRPGPVLLVTSAIHGDEINGVAIVRRLLSSAEGKMAAGTLVAIPVVNRFGFDAQDRYLPDRRDLNRHFPGDRRGHMASRIADHLFRKLVLHCDVGVDLHTAADGATNLCHIRGEAGRRDVRPLMKAFGTPILVDGKGPAGSLRRAATEAGVPTVLFEAGEPARFQPHVVDVGHQGLLRLMRHLRMLDGKPAKPELQILVRESKWVRSDHGGILDLEVEPGDLVASGARLGTLHDPLGRHVDEVTNPADGVVLGTTTTPLVFPGTAMVHVGRLRRTFAAAQAFVAAGGDLGHLGSAAGRGP